MKRYLIPLLLIPVLSFSQNKNIQSYIETKVICLDGDEVYSTLTQFGEKPMLMMSTTRTYGTEPDIKEKFLPTILFVNPKTGTWSIVERHSDNMSCVTSVGQQMSPY